MFKDFQPIAEFQDNGVDRWVRLELDAEGLEDLKALIENPTGTMPAGRLSRLVQLSITVDRALAWARGGAQEAA